MSDFYIKYKKGVDDMVVLEGFHAIKHAYRFGADIKEIITPNKKEITSLCSSLAPDMMNYLRENLKEIEEKDFLKIFPKNLHGQIAALTEKKKNKDLDGLLVWLENPSLINNVGATVRVLAARGVKNLIISGAEFNIWHKDSIRASAGLHFALDCIRQFSNSDEVIDILKRNNYSLVSLDPAGDILNCGFGLSDKTCIIFGGERNGISEFAKSSSDYVFKIPMQENVSSMNLATSVSAALYFKYSS